MKPTDFDPIFPSGHGLGYSVTQCAYSTRMSTKGMAAAETELGEEGSCVGSQGCRSSYSPSPPDVQLWSQATSQDKETDIELH